MNTTKTATTRNRVIAFLVAAFVAVFMLGICSPQAAYAGNESGGEGPNADGIEQGKQTEGDEKDKIVDQNLSTSLDDAKDVKDTTLSSSSVPDDPEKKDQVGNLGSDAGTSNGTTSTENATDPVVTKTEDDQQKVKKEADDDVDDDTLLFTMSDGSQARVSKSDIIKVQSETVPVSKVGLTGNAHVQRKGWMADVSAGQTIGTTGQALRMEALQLSLANMGDNNKGSIHYQVHMQNRGWMGAVSDGGVAGVTGKSLRLEAAKIWLSGDISRHYDVYYKGHVQNIGWQTWVKNGGVAGTTGRSLRLEALQVILSPKTEEAAGKGADTVGVRYDGHVQNVGWQTWRGDGAEIGTHGRSLRMEAVNLVLSTGGISGGIEYQAHVQDIGWQKKVANGATAGTTGKSKRMEAIKIWLTGDIANYYDVYYQTHCENYGWLGWAKNGEAAGTANGSLRMEAMKVVVQKKGTSAPGSTSRPYIWIKETPQQRYVKRAAGVVRWIDSWTNYMIAVDLSNHWLTIFRGSAGNWTPYKNWQVSTGAPGSPTVTGDFTVGSRGYSFGHGYTCYYWTQFYGDYLFHSIKYDEGTFNVQDGRLGRSISMGCVRMAIGNAEWIYDNIPSGTHVKTFW